MKRILFHVALAAIGLFLLAGCEGEVSGNDPCDGVTCGDHGNCVNNDGTAECSCEAGYHAEGLNCVPDGGDCVDGDGDTYGQNCAAGADCDDSNANLYQNLTGYTDADGDTYGTGSAQQVCSSASLPTGYADRAGDCDDSDPAHWNDCAGCTDNDGDGYGDGCASGADCDDADADNWTSCATCADTDGDGWFASCDAYANHQGPDCDAASADHWDDCATCTDNDGDGHGTGCNLGDDCDDTDDTVFENCDNFAQLTWVAPTTNEDDTPLTDLAGYRVYYGTQTGTYTTDVWVGNVTTYRVEPLPSGMHYFIVKAVDTSGNESLPSNEASKDIP